ncbi:MAG TPA: hypothetical protein PK867_06390, partial [Pirellulales bacterium]|nr:hypothetical protein [Pirellulales bacterium]
MPRATTMRKTTTVASAAVGASAIDGSFDFQEQRWGRAEPHRSRIDAATGRPLSRFEYEDMKLVIAARSEGGFDVWDSYRNSGSRRLRGGASAWGESRRFSLGPREVWDG